MRIALALTALVAAALAGCADHDHDDFDLAPGYTFQITVHNLDPAIYQVWIEAEADPNDAVLLDVVDVFYVSSTYIAVAPGRPYRVVLADIDGDVLDSASIGAISEASTTPYLVTLLARNGRLE